MKRVLEPHFRCESITYWQHGSLLGALAVVFNLSAFAFLVLAFVAGRNWLAPWYVVVLCIVFLVLATAAVSVGVARYRRRRVVDKVKPKISEKGIQQPVHIVAHSFGTYILGWALMKFHDLSFGKVVLVGSMLPQTFDWASIRRKRRHAFGAIKATHPDFQYQPIAEPEELGNGGRVRWVSGRPDEAPAYAGTDFIIARDRLLRASQTVRQQLAVHDLAA